MIVLTDKIEFPDVSLATRDGLLAIGGDLSVERLLLAYKSGIFPWFEIEQPILWWSPDPRFVLYPEKLKISKSMQQFLKKTEFRVTTNRAFEEVIKNCSKIKRSGQQGTWITNTMIKAYCNLHELGYAKSFEVWDKDNLIGGLYGIDFGNQVFCGESMFSKKSNASKLAFIKLIEQSNYKLKDCQVHTKHIESLGAEEIPRENFLKIIN
ncbi:MAG: leucyl/phenylalanyl-tRNA--protein transferase [Bacteroidia bacterium]|nr:leucyl/phenylalanyl-tRNA--protein transferase [Bacteroidia bacterium]